MLHTLKGNGFDCLFTLVSIKMEHPRPLQECTNVCIIFARTGAGVIMVNKKNIKIAWAFTAPNLVTVHKVRMNNCKIN